MFLDSSTCKNKTRYSIAHQSLLWSHYFRKCILTLNLHIFWFWQGSSPIPHESSSIWSPAGPWIQIAKKYLNEESQSFLLSSCLGPTTTMPSPFHSHSLFITCEAGTCSPILASGGGGGGWTQNKRQQKAWLSYISLFNYPEPEAKKKCKA